MAVSLRKRRSSRLKGPDLRYNILHHALSSDAKEILNRIKILQAKEKDQLNPVYANRIDARYINGVEGEEFHDDSNWGVDGDATCLQKAQVLRGLAKILVDYLDWPNSCLITYVNCRSGITRSTAVVMTALLLMGLVTTGQLKSAVAYAHRETGRAKCALRALMKKTGYAIEHAATERL